ncbi:MAG: redox-regulated ATPase YchF, partial [Candidatus Omnitrophica bacterium]|nr:redox-regulated ATPase YchF [Candidatus Omnitrophota bacterium]
KEEVLHPEGSINPQRDILLFEKLLIEEDLTLIVERIQRIESELKKGKKDNQKEFELLNRLKETLESKKALRSVELTIDEERLIRGFKLLSLKPITRVVNLGEEKKQADIEKLKNELNQEGFSVIEFYGRLEFEIEELEDEKLKEDFLKDLGIELCGVEVFIKKVYDNIGLITFFTIGEDQVRGWSILKGIKAPQAAGKIHSDMERGFIRTEVIDYTKFKDAPSFHSAKQKGILRQEDKDYIVKDGDIINFKFSI